MRNVDHDPIDGGQHMLGDAEDKSAFTMLERERRRVNLVTAFHRW